MQKRVSFWVPGTPKPQGSKRGLVHPKTGRVVMMESAGTPLKNWRHDVSVYAMKARGRRGLVPRYRPVEVRIDFVLPRPVGLPKTKPTPPATKTPDLDKAARAVLDSLTSAIYQDDSQVVRLHLAKRIAELGEQSGAHITVYAEEKDL